MQQYAVPIKDLDITCQSNCKTSTLSCQKHAIVKTHQDDSLKPTQTFDIYDPYKPDPFLSLEEGIFRQLFGVSFTGTDNVQCIRTISKPEYVNTFDYGQDFSESISSCQENMLPFRKTILSRTMNQMTNDLSAMLHNLAHKAITL